MKMYQTDEFGSILREAEGGSIDRRYVEACKWLNGLGIKYQPTRFGSYQKRIDEYTDKSLPELNGDERQDLVVFLNSQLEAIKLVRIHSAFKEISNPEINKKIKNIASGRELAKAENNSQARDLAFELGVAARFIKGGYEVDLESITDVVAIVEGRRIYIECKRIKSQAKLKARIKKANEQLRKRLKRDNSSKSRGMIALELTEVFTAENTVIFERSAEVYRRKCTQMLHDYFSKYKDDIEHSRLNNCLGVLAEFTTQGILTKVSSDGEIIDESIEYANVRESTMYVFRPGSENEKICERISPRLVGHSFF